MTEQDWFRYDPESGLVFWKKKKSKKTDIEQSVGSNNGNGYLVAFLNGKKIYIHRLAWYLTHGYWPREVDHVNRNRADNRIENLREVTRRENSQNTKRFNKGTYYDGYAWRSSITINKIKIDLGRFKTEEEAQQKYERTVLSL